MTTDVTRTPAPALGPVPYATPLVRRMASEKGVDLATVSGTGIGGRISKRDVAAAGTREAAPPVAVSPSPASPQELRGRTVTMPRMRKVIGANLLKALHEQAQLTSVVEVDLTRVMRLRDRTKAAFAAREGIKLSPMPFFVAAAVQALKAHPVVNARIDEAEGTLTYFDFEHVGIAVDAEKGLMTPVVRDAGDLAVTGLARRIANLADRVRTGRITPDELSGATFTISNTGSRGALFDTVIVPPGQAANLGIGVTVRRPVVIGHPELGETLAIRDMTHLALSYDHRLIDGADAARYLTTVKQILEEGDFGGELTA